MPNTILTCTNGSFHAPPNIARYNMVVSKFLCLRSNDFCINCGHCLPGQGPSSAYSCVSCKAGQYSNEKTTHMCRECPSGYYQVYQGMSHCIQCPEGSYCPYPSSEPMLCPHGSHCPNGSMQPVYCTNNLLEYDSKTQVGVMYVCVYVCACLCVCVCVRVYVACRHSCVCARVFVGVYSTLWIINKLTVH